MSIEINGFNGPHTTGAADSSQVSNERNPATQSQQAGTQAASNDTVKLTDAAKQLSELENAVKDASSVDTQRVEQLRNAVNEGTYEVNPTQVAQKVLQFEAYLPKP